MVGGGGTPHHYSICLLSMSNKCPPPPIIKRINMPNKEAKNRKRQRRKLNETLSRQGRTSIQYQKYLKKIRKKTDV